jgi:hypothetical protein
MAPPSPAFDRARRAQCVRPLIRRPAMSRVGAAVAASVSVFQAGLAQAAEIFTVERH